MGSAAGWNSRGWVDAMDDYYIEYVEVGIGPDACNAAALLTITRGADDGQVRQVFDDPAGDRDWGITAEIDLAASDEAGEAAVKVLEVGPFSR